MITNIQPITVSPKSFHCYPLFSRYRTRGPALRSHPQQLFSFFMLQLRLPLCQSGFLESDLLPLLIMLTIDMDPTQYSHSWCWLCNVYSNNPPKCSWSSCGGWTRGNKCLQLLTLRYYVMNSWSQTLWFWQKFFKVWGTPKLIIIHRVLQWWQNGREIRQRGIIFWWRWWWRFDRWKEGRGKGETNSRFGRNYLGYQACWEWLADNVLKSRWNIPGQPFVWHQTSSSLMKHCNQRKALRASPENASSRSSDFEV